MRENGSLWPHEALHCMEKWVQKRAAVGTGLMEGVTQEWDHEASANLEIKENGELPPWRGEFFRSSEHTHGRTNKSIWGLEMTRLSRQTERYVSQESNLYMLEESAGPEHSLESIPFFSEHDK